MPQGVDRVPARHTPAGELGTWGLPGTREAQPGTGRHGLWAGLDPLCLSHLPACCQNTAPGWTLRFPKSLLLCLLAENYNNTKTKNKTFPENPLRLRAGLGLGAGTAAEAASSPGASLRHVGTLPLFVLPVNKAKQSIKRHLETSETHSFHVTYFKKR